MNEMRCLLLSVSWPWPLPLLPCLLRRLDSIDRSIDRSLNISQPRRTRFDTTDQMQPTDLTHRLCVSLVGLGRGPLPGMMPKGSSQHTRSHPNTTLLQSMTGASHRGLFIRRTKDGCAAAVFGGGTSGSSSNCRRDASAAAASAAGAAAGRGGAAGAGGGPHGGRRAVAAGQATEVSQFTTQFDRPIDQSIHSINWLID